MSVVLENRISLAGIYLAIVSLAGLLVAPITVGLFEPRPDGGVLGCGTFLSRWGTKCYGCCDSHGAYDERFRLAAAVFAGAVVLVAVGQTGRIVQRVSRGRSKQDGQVSQRGKSRWSATCLRGG